MKLYIRELESNSVLSCSVIKWSTQTPKHKLKQFQWTIKQFQQIDWSNITRYQTSCYCNILEPSHVIWQQRSRSTLARVIVCCLTAISHYLNQCWLIIIRVLWHLPQDNFTRHCENIYPWYACENYNFNISAISLRNNWVNHSSAKSIMYTESQSCHQCTQQYKVFRRHSTGYKIWHFFFQFSKAVILSKYRPVPRRRQRPRHVSHFKC